jgi:hypothetical protein
MRYHDSKDRLGTNIKGNTTAKAEKTDALLASES